LQNKKALCHRLRGAEGVDAKAWKRDKFEKPFMKGRIDEAHEDPPSERTISKPDGPVGKKKKASGKAVGGKW